MASRVRLDVRCLLCLLLLHVLAWVDGIVFMKQMSHRVVTTRYGKVRGILVEFPNRHLRPVEAYLGLKYADLNQGEMRFMPPKNPMEKWQGIRVAIKHQPVCPQKTKHERELSEFLPDGRVAHLRNITPFLNEQTEECLTLNLYVPIQEWNETTPMAVMVFIHGESYESGTGNAYDGSVLSSYGDVIVVTLNYRLGVLGFLSTADHAAMGNYALLDITQALHWLRENIASFNGDPRKVTLLGHGHGAALVNLLMLSPFFKEARGQFFQRAIIQSGSALSTWSVSYDPLWCTQKLAINVNCSEHISKSQDLIKCLRSRSYMELVNAVPNAPKYYSCFAPSIDGWTVLPKPAEDMIKERSSRFSSSKIMFGITKNEAYAYLNQQEIKKGLSEFRKTQIIRTYVQNVFRYHRQKIYEILDHHYTEWNRMSDAMTRRNNILEMLSDGQYISPLVKTAQYHSETADTYLYAFTYSTQSESDAGSDDVHGIHGDELPYVFGAPLVNGLSPFPSSYTGAEKMMSEAVMTYWTNFAKTGNPNEPRNQTSIHGGRIRNRFVEMEWPKFDAEDQQFLQIARRPSLRHHYRGQKLALWLDLIPKINKDDGSSDPAVHQLHDADNMSTFDDHTRLMPAFDSIFPSPPPIPPIAPTPWGRRNEGAWSTAGFGKDVTDEPDFSDNTRYSLRSSENQEGSTPLDGEALGEQNEGTAGPIPALQSPSGAHSSVPLSVTVAVGCSLLFFNILILAGVHYQRERIKKMRRRQEEVAEEEQLGLAMKAEMDAAAKNCTSPESVSLMANPPPAQPAPKTATGGGAGPEVSPQNNRHVAVVNKPPDPGYSYSAVPTRSTSPLHHAHGPPGRGGGGSGPMQMNTFHPPKDSSSKPVGDGLYSRINKPSQRENCVGSNNAITIV